MPTVRAGSQIAIFGIIRGWKITFLVCVASSVITPARPTSEPVPAVVGTATTGAIAISVRAHPIVADVLEIPDRALLPGHERDELAGIERRAATKGDDAVMAVAAVNVDFRNDVGLDRVGTDGTEQASLQSRLGKRRHSVLHHRGDREIRVGDDERPRHLAARMASASSAIRPAPKRIAVG